ncbi:hypothetical protein NL676_021381 [Syzygium grande]|nr:hypothetical protein NL676_021381 [Syzygium grande]
MGATIDHQSWCWFAFEAYMQSINAISKFPPINHSMAAREVYLQPPARRAASGERGGTIGSGSGSGRGRGSGEREPRARPASGSGSGRGSGERRARAASGAEDGSSSVEQRQSCFSPNLEVDALDGGREGLQAEEARQPLSVLGDEGAGADAVIRSDLWRHRLVCDSQKLLVDDWTSGAVNGKEKNDNLPSKIEADVGDLSNKKKQVLELRSEQQKLLSEREQRLKPESKGRETGKLLELHFKRTGCEQCGSSSSPSLPCQNWKLRIGICRGCPSTILHGYLDPGLR